MRSMQFMQKFLLIFMALSVLFISGCGGSIYSDSDSGDSDTDTEQEEENEKADTHDTEIVLAGNWVIMEGSGSAVNTVYGTDDTLTLRMDHAVIRFSDVQISGDVGSADLYYSHLWHAFGDSEVYRGEFNVTSYSYENDAVKTRAVRLTHVASDNWRVYDAENEDNIIMITFDSASAITTEWEGFSYSDSNIESERVKDYHYTLECTFRKE